MTTPSGNETPGYPRVNSVPPRSLSCNGYPGLNEYGGNYQTPNTQALSNTSLHSNQMQPPLPQSPNCQQPSRPNSTNSLYQQKQSPVQFNNNVHMSPRSQTHSPLSHQINGVSSNQPNFQPSHIETPSSNNHEGGEDWNQKIWNAQQSQYDVFNQSDRINLNTRLKTMIINKSEKDQQLSSNHFLSYSHQHLYEQNQALSNPIDKVKLNINEEKLSKPGDVGGFEMNNQWKLLRTKEIEEKKIDHKNEIIENTSVKDSKPIAQEHSFDKFVAINEARKSADHIMNKNISKEVTVNDGEQQSHSYHSAHEYQQHKNMVNKIKKEPTEEGATENIKFEGYEKNYQNFIRYADFCDAQQPQYDPQGYYNMYPYQNYVPPSQAYAQSPSQSYQQFISQHPPYQSAHQEHQENQPPHVSTSLTNFEQQIPLHTYPIHKHSWSSNTSVANLTTSSKIKTESTSPNMKSMPLTSENDDNVNKVCTDSFDDGFRKSPSILVSQDQEVRELHCFLMNCLSIIVFYCVAFKK